MMTKNILLALIATTMLLSATAIVIGGDPGNPSTPPPPSTTPTSVPVASTPIAAPIMASVPVSNPVSAPVASPVTSPVTVPDVADAPIDEPLAAPIDVSIDVPIATPVDTPINVPVTAPVTVPISTPVTVPVSAPIPTPVSVPIATPVTVPVSVPIQAPVAAPIAPPNPVASSYVGCFYDSATRDLPFKIYSLNNNSNVYCIRRCSLAGYAYAGTQSSNECWCGNSYGSQGQWDDQQCNAACAGDPTQKCGGAYKNSVYRTPWRHLGCYPDSATRDLPFNAYWANTKSTIDKCRTICRLAGYVFAGAQTGNECWCGNSFGSQGARLSDSSCSMACSGGTGICGGSYKNSIYRV